MLNRKSIKDLAKISSPIRIKKKPELSLKKVNSYANANKLPKIIKKKEVNLSKSTNKKIELVEDTRTGSSIFNQIEKHSKVYEDEIVKFLGIDISEPSARETLKNSILKAKLLPIKKSDWKSQLSTIDKEEVQLKKSLEELDLKHSRTKKKLDLSPIPAKNLNFVEKSAFKLGKVISVIRGKSKNVDSVY